jgi:hypothetical protein
VVAVEELEEQEIMELEHPHHQAQLRQDQEGMVQRHLSMVLQQQEPVVVELVVQEQLSVVINLITQVQVDQEVEEQERQTVQVQMELQEQQTLVVVEVAVIYKILLALVEQVEKE